MEYFQPPRPRRASSPRLLRCKSSSSACVSVSKLELKASHPPQFIQKSKSTRTTPASEKTEKQSTNIMHNKNPPSKLIQQRSPLHYGVSNFTSGRKSVSKSPSAWALSPGRSLVPPSPDFLNSRKVTAEPKMKSVRGGVSGVLKYFRIKKKNPVLDEEVHQFRVLHNRLLQWRFANARSETAMAAIKIQAESKLFSVSLQVLRLRNTIMEKKIWVQRNQQKFKMLKIIVPQVCLLEDWMRIEKRNFEALSRMTRKLSAISAQLPLVDGAEANIATIYHSMSMVMDIMEIFEEFIPDLLYRGEMTYNLLQELTVTAEKQKECLNEIRELVAVVSSFEATERSSRLCLIQKVQDLEYFQHLAQKFDLASNVSV